jgi:hypothetical protein
MCVFVGGIGVGFGIGVILYDCLKKDNQAKTDRFRFIDCTTQMAV